MNEIIKLETLELELAREFLVDENNIKKLEAQIDDLKNNVYDFSTVEGIKQAKEFKTNANKFVKELKEFCEPLEADGKKIANARSAITTRLATGKNAVVEQILAPIYEREDKIKLIKNKLFMPSLNSGANAEKLAEVEALNNYNWLAFEKEAKDLLLRHKSFLTNEKINFDEETRLAKESEEKARLEKENQIKLEAEAKANAMAELKIKQECERLEKAIKQELEAQKRKLEIETQEAEKLSESKEHKAKIHNEILEDLSNEIYFAFPFSVESKSYSEDLAKNIIKSIAKGKIKNLKINY